MDDLGHERQYHSVALLLPNGQVMVAGNEGTNDRTIEVFSPPYLFRPDGTLAPRPVIAAVPASIHHGATFTIDTPDALQIAKVVLVRPAAVTHQTDTEQRVILLCFARTGTTTLSATAPDGWYPHALAPRGYYMLFLVDSQGVPSQGRFVDLQ